MFALNCVLWLEIPGRLRSSYVMLAVLAFAVLTWPCDVGMVRPENYSTAVLMLGGLLAFRLRRAEPPLCHAYSLLAAVCLAMAVSFSLRSIFLVFAGVF